ncbi:hypothetical protein CYLTODRAFT_489438 [Cylindrobasidium torrendii FP15055 ss-10]|uniref:Uncharacterized protein n=1 Tax=Cylindrobasidium torrendii FP15055 ss-10 TaxID=1314674 RepID=A0A0D7BEB7_9AGAR|nr:hypothetical protein CYLTODRAFT_489438 [Cylindrobasidium torrendii FP15055 ss-10]
MNILHLEHDVSNSFFFGMPEERLLHKGPTIALISHQIASGLRPGEFALRKDELWNKLHLQRGLALSFTVLKLCFRPCEDVINAILKVYQHNASCGSLESRVRLDEVPLLRLPVECSLEIDRKLHQYPIYTKHPESGAVTNHFYPYTTLPRFTLPSADPGLLSITAQHVSRLILASAASAELTPDPISQIPELWRSAGIRVHAQGFWDESSSDVPTSQHSPETQSSTTSSKRKRNDDTVTSKPSKRVRGCTTPEQICARRNQSRVCASARRPERSRDEICSMYHSPKAQTVPPHVVLAAASGSSVTSKRKKDDSQICDSQQDITPKAKRTRRDISAVVVPTRTIYARASKSQGIARMSRMR